MSKLYEFKLKDIDGNEFNFEQLQQKVVLIVNTASKYGFTPQFEGLQKLHEKYGQKDLVILGFPTNDFLWQDPGVNSDIKNFCMLNYGVDFTMFEKTKVRGKNKNPLYDFLVEGAGNPSHKGSIKWNFTKFLFDKNGEIKGRFGSNVTPEEIEKSIIPLLE